MTAPKQRNTAHERDYGLLAILALMALIFVVIVVSWFTRFDKGELILTEQGCKALAAHEAPIEPLDDNGLCRAVVEFQFSNRTERFGTVRVQTSRGRIELELPGSTVVSKAIR